jgi:hypothetical protein
VIEYHRTGLENVAELKFRDCKDALVHKAAGQSGVRHAKLPDCKHATLGVEPAFINHLKSFVTSTVGIPAEACP